MAILRLFRVVNGFFKGLFGDGFMVCLRGCLGTVLWLV